MPIKSAAVVVLIVAGSFTGGVVVGSAPPTQSPAANDETTVWNLERSYWRYVQDNDLVAYRALWHEDFLGWPSGSPQPLRKDHITDWITSETSKGSRFKTGEFKPAAMQIRDGLATACYWITISVVDPNGKATESVLRIIHTWRKADEKWQIVSGMSMVIPQMPR